MPHSPETCVSSTKEPLTRFFTMNQPNLIHASKHMPPCIAHFRNQSWDHFRHRRSAHRVRDDTGKPWQQQPRDRISMESPIPPLCFMEEANEIEFPFVAECYSFLPHK